MGKMMSKKSYIAEKWAGAEISLERIGKNLVSLMEFEKAEKRHFVTSSDENRKAVMDYIFGIIDENPMEAINVKIDEKRKQIQDVVDNMHYKLLKGNADG
jgi:Na+/phosphate symporter